MRLSFIICSVVAFMLASCGHKASFSIDTFHEFPIDIGCSCSFGETEKKLRNGEYVLGTDFDSAAYISVNGKMLELKLTGTNRNDTLNDDRTDTFANNEFRLIVKPKKIKEAWEESESVKYEGRLKIENKAGETAEKKFVGECGC